MDQLERDLQAALDDRRLDLPLRPDAGSLIRAGVHRRRRNRAVASVAAAVVVAAGIGIGAAATGQGDGTQRIVPPANTSPTPTTAQKPPRPAPSTAEVPWAATAYDYHHPPAFPGAVADPSVPWCRSSQLSLSQSFQGATGNLFGGVAVQNTSSTTCAVQGQPAVRVEAADGHSLVASTPEPFYVDQWVRLAPGKQAGAQVFWMQEFCREPSPARLTVALPHNGGLLSTTMSDTPRCNAPTDRPSAGTLNVDGFLTGQDKPFTPQAGLEASIDRPTTSAIPGGVVSYRLQLQSMHAPQVALDPCLPYRERLVDTRTQHVLREEDHLLNCPAAPGTIADPQSNRSTYFDLQISVPPDAPVGDYALVWQSVLKPVNAASDNDVRIGTGPPACTDGQLSASAGSAGAAAGTYVQTIVLSNVSGTSCSLYGYPGVRLVDAAGRPLGKDASRGGGPGFTDAAPTTVLLAAHGGKASFSFAGAGYDNAAQRACPVSAAALVYPPGTRRQLRVALAQPYCPGGIATGPVVPGTHGAGP